MVSSRLPCDFNCLGPQISPMLLDKVISKVPLKNKFFNYISYTSNSPMFCVITVSLVYFFGKSMEVSILEEIHNHEAPLEIFMEVK